MRLPSISIITPCLNRAEYIRDAIESVFAQNYFSFEHIIIDGGSSDGTLDILQRYPHLRVVSEADTGMYAAINKGIHMARGDVVGFLNSDDLYEPNLFDCVEKKFMEVKTLAVVGDALVFSIHPNGVSEITGRFSPKNANLLELATMGDPFFNAWFFQRSVFEKLGYLNTAYRIVADRDFMLKFALSGLDYGILEAPVYQYRQHPKSMTFDVTDQKLQKITAEHLIMTGIYLRQRSLPVKAKELIRKFRTRDTLELAVRSLKKMNFSKFAYYSLQGIRYDPFWLLTLIRRVRRKNR